MDLSDLFERPTLSRIDDRMFVDWLRRYVSTSSTSGASHALEAKAVTRTEELGGVNEVTRATYVVLGVTPIVTDYLNVGTCLRSIPPYTLLPRQMVHSSLTMGMSHFGRDSLDAAVGVRAGDIKWGDFLVKHLAPLRALGSITTSVLVAVWTGGRLLFGGTGAMLGPRLWRA